MSLEFSKLMSVPDAATEGIILDCKTIRLIQNKESSPRVWTAPGSINVDFRAGVSARIVIHHAIARPLDRLAELMELSRVKLGDLRPASHYFSMTAIDSNGDKWTNPSVEVDAEHYEGCTVLSISCDWIRCETTVQPEADSARLLFVDDIEFPLNESKRTEISLGDRTVTSSEKGGSSGCVRLGRIFVSRAAGPGQFCEFYAACDSGKALPDNYVAKLLEAIHFVTASRVSSCATEIVRGGRRVIELSRAPRAHKGLVMPPLLAKGPRADDFYKLFDAYLDYSLGATPDESYSPTAIALYPLLGTGELPVETVALLASVAVERLAQTCLPAHAIADPALSSEVDQILAAVAGLKISDSAKKRAEGLLGSIKSTRAIDRLHALASEGFANASEIASWKSLRNRAAHGSLHVDPEKQQALLGQIYSVNVLANRVIMTAIGYKGPFNDYSIRGWPLADHPNSEMPASTDDL